MSQHSSREIQQVTILGSGPAGLTAAIYAARANLQPLLIDGAVPGGQLMITSDVENYPGFPEAVVGPDLMENFRKQAERFGTKFVSGEVTKVDISKQPLQLTLANGMDIFTRSLIIATGASAKWIGIPSEKQFMGKGVSACATCDGFFFRGADIVVVGGGDTAMEEATFLTRFAKSVTVVHRRDKLRASKIMQDKAMKNPKIRFLWDSAIHNILGDSNGTVNGVEIKNLKTNQIHKLDVTGVFVAIGHEPNTAVFRDSGLKFDPQGYLVPEPVGTSRTNMPGVFVAGDVCDHVYRQAVTAAGMGCMAAIDAERYLESIEDTHEHSKL